jgi:tripartite-type tricarboxylate transporter receptor subunit TctC
MKLNAEMVRILRLPDVGEKLAAMGVEIIGNSPDEFARIIKSDVVRWGKVVRDAGIKAE